MIAWTRVHAIDGWCLDLMLSRIHVACLGEIPQNIVPHGIKNKERCGQIEGQYGDLIVIARSRSDDHHKTPIRLKGPMIAIVHHDGSLSNDCASISFSLNVFFATRRTVRDYPSNSPCVEIHFARRLFESILDSFLLQLNAEDQSLIEREGRIHILNSIFVFKNLE